MKYKLFTGLFFLKLLATEVLVVVVLVVVSSKVQKEN